MSHGVASVPTQHTFVPKTMAELAEERNDDAANGRMNVEDDVEEWGDDPSFVKPPETSKGKGKAPARTAKGKAKAKKATTPKRLVRSGSDRRRTMMIMKRLMKQRWMARWPQWRRNHGLERSHRSLPSPLRGHSDLGNLRQRRR